MIEIAEKRGGKPAFGRILPMDYLDLLQWPALATTVMAAWRWPTGGRFVLDIIFHDAA